MEKEKVPSRRQKKRRGVPQGTKAIENGKLLLTVEEMVVTARLARGDYNRNQVYGNVAVKPVVPWTIAVPVGTLEGPEALRQALSALQDAVAEAVLAKATELEGVDRGELKQATAKALSSTDGGKYRHAVEVETQVTSIEGRPLGRPLIKAVAGEPPDDEDLEF